MTDKTRILIFSTAYYPMVGGAEVAIKELTDRLDNYDFDLITARLDRALPAKEKIGRVTVYRVGFGFKVDKLILAFWGPILGYKMHYFRPYKAIWAMMASFGGVGSIILKKALKDVPLVVTLQEGDDLAGVEKKAWILGFLWKDLFRQAEVVTCISTYLAQWAKRLGSTGEVVVIPNGVDLEVFTERQAKIILDHAFIVTTSRLVYKNGVDTLIRAMKFLPPNSQLAIVGDGPDRAGLEKLVQDLRLENQIEFIGFLPQAEMIKYLRQADVFVRSSRTEGLGNSFLEAMAVGVPVVGTLVGGITDFLVDKETGLVAEVDNPESVAIAINFILDRNNKNIVNEIKRKALNLVTTKYNWATIVLQVRAIFDLLTGNDR